MIDEDWKREREKEEEKGERRLVTATVDRWLAGHTLRQRQHRYTVIWHQVPAGSGYGDVDVNADVSMGDREAPSLHGHQMCLVLRFFPLAMVMVVTVTVVPFDGPVTQE
ncbi:hypothetical protein MGYG_05991 [Nannizzia gypsea CBS 118893]|uniref:Uncharacterized protein n=1 Tax=Arthroderma gypseum (strain ATCC MYA-4604 / CBS 118893) TaxID=535722 RepID=E4V054_ARTGP|nr:hypothetical protein MGYG_05991 [Nannizzia gypsea CBS 118893]EFR02991.1 hypothetical protein MGYG_05991 [Nannizzia gypsea CBS 118893]